MELGFFDYFLVMATIFATYAGLVLGITKFEKDPILSMLGCMFAASMTLSTLRLLGI